MKRALMLTAACVLLAATPALAGSADDGNAGLAALNRHAYDEAIRLFTRALKAGDLAPGDQEFAYLNRGKAYQAKGQIKLAKQDFATALRLSPDDPDAQSLAGGSPSSVAEPPPKQVAQIDPDAAWGPIIRFVNSYWMEMDKDPQVYQSCQWQVKHSILACSGMQKSGKTYTSAYERDSSTDKITYSETANGTAPKMAVEVTDGSFTIDIEANGKYARQTYTATSASAFSVAVEVYDNDTWKPVRTLSYVQASPEIIQALGWKERKPGFWNNLGHALVQGAVEGLAAGLQPQQ